MKNLIPDNKLSNITPREQEVIELIAYEHSSREIASKLYVSPETVNSHRKNIMNKLGAKNTAGVVRMAFELGLMRVGHAVCLLLFFFVNNNQAQVSNGSTYNFEMRTTSFTFGTSNADDVQDGTNYPTFQIKSAIDSDNSFTNLMNSSIDQNAGYQYCHNWNADIPTTNTGVYMLQSKTNTTQTKVDLHINNYDKNNNSGTRCKYESYFCAFCTSTDYKQSGSLTLPNAVSGNPAQWNSFTHNISANNSTINLQRIWRYTNGNTSGSALDFGTLNAGDSKFHDNSNRSAPAGASSSMGYSNQWAGPGDYYHNGNDIFYKFTISGNNKKVSISTNETYTNFNTKLILTLASSPGSAIVTNDDVTGTGTKSLIVADLGPETYMVIVKGYDRLTQGDFRLRVSAVDATVNPGSISLTGSSSLCKDEEYGTINSSILASPGTPRSLSTDRRTTSFWNYNTGSISYQWEKAEGSDGFSTDGLGGATTSNLSQSSNRKMPDLNSSSTKTVRFRRVATIGGNSASTPSTFSTFTFRPSSITPGAIEYRNVNNIIKDPIPPLREGYADDGSINSTGSATGSPSPITYQYQYSTDDFSSHTSISAFNTNSGLNLSSIGNLNQATKLRRVAKNDCNVEAFSNVLTIPVLAADGGISGKTTSPPANGQAGVGIEGIEVCATPVAPFNGVLKECDITDSEGEYFIDELYYGDQAVEFVVKPTLLNHIIRTTATSGDSTRNVTINTTQATRTVSNQNFVDLTPYTVQGNVYQTFQSQHYGKQGVVIRLNGIAKDTTDENGDYGLIIPSIGTWTITPEFIDTSGFTSPARRHTFDQPEREIFVDANKTGINFEDTSKRRLKISVVGNCNSSPTYLGTVQLKIKDAEKDNGATNSIVVDLNTANGTGIYNEVMPARLYTVDIVASGTNLGNRPNPYPYDQVTNVQNQLEAHPDLKFDLRFAGDTTEVFYRPPLDLVLDRASLPSITTCNGTDLEDLIFLKTGELYPNFGLTVYEGPEANGCLLDTGYVDINDVIADNEGILQISKGKVITSKGEYKLMAGNPNIGGDHLKQSSYTAYTLNGTSPDTETLVAVVEGEKARDKSFVTVTPQIPTMILHDPPTDRGFSWVEKNTSYDVGFKTYTRQGKEYGGWLAGKVGFESTMEVGIGVSIGTGNKVWGTVTGTIRGEETSTTVDQKNISFSTNEKFETSETLIGSDGDVYIGAAFNMIYANTDKIIVDTDACEVKNDVGMIIEPNNIATTFVYNTIGIETQISKLKNIVKIFPDSIKYYEEQIKVWEQTLEDNKKYKQSVIESGDKKDFVGNYSFNGQNAITRTVKYDTTHINTHEFNIELDGGVAAELGFEIAGSGVSGGDFVNFKMETITTNDTTETNTFESGYKLFDDDPNDVFTVDVYNDSRYNTPFFDLVAGATSCPWEGAPDEEGELPGEKVDDFTVQIKTGFPSTVTNVPPNQSAEYKFVISNISPTYTSTYRVRVDPKYNTDNAIIQLSGFAPGITGRYQNVGPGESIEIGVLVSRPNTNTYSFNDLRLIFETECSFEADMYGDEVTREVRAISATFLSECSSIRIAAPDDNRIVNISDNNLIQIIMKDYDKSKIDNVTLQYSKQGRGNWNNSSIVLQQSELNTDAIVDGTGVDWDLSEILEDGEYEIRLKTVCGLTINYSPLVNIVIDREQPEVFGLPFPIDDRYDFDQNDIISVSYDEPINCSNASALIIDIINGDTIPMNLTPLTCFNNTIDVTPPSFVGRTPSVYRVVLNGVKDLNENDADEYRWIFVVGEFDFEEAVCLPQLNISNNNLDQDAISVSAYRALKIIADGIVPDFGETSLTAQEDITFGAGFTVNTGGDLIAEIEDCDAPIICEEVISPEGLGSAPGEILRFEIIENDDCIDNIFFEKNPQTTDVMVEIKDFVSSGDPSALNVSLTLTRPLNAGTLTEDLVLNLGSQETTTTLGIYDAINGKQFTTSVKLNYYSATVNGVLTHLVKAQVIMTPTNN